MPRPAAPARPLTRRTARAWATAAVLAVAGPLMGVAQAAPPASVILSTYQPKVVGGPGVEIETPPEDQWDQCKVEPLRNTNDSGYLVVGPQDQTLRRIVDADGDGTIELFIYYNQGMEVFREWDADGAQKNDKGEAVVSSNNFRWVNFGGTKWGVDTNGDRRIDAWKRISPAEAAAVAAEAVVDGDAAKLATVLVTAEELKSLGVDDALAARIVEELADPAKQLAAIRKDSELLRSKPTFQSVNTGQPGLILPGESARGELEVVENSNALLNVPDGNMGIVSLSEMVRVGSRLDSVVWKLTALPRPVEGNGQIVLGGPLIQPPPGMALGDDGDGLAPEVAKLLGELAKLNEDRPDEKSTKAQRLDFAAKQLKLHRELFKVDQGNDRPFWLTTQADTFHGLFLNEDIEAEFAQAEMAKIRKLAAAEAPGALPVVDQRSLFVAWGEKRRPLGADPAQAELEEFETWWRTAREGFVTKYPESNEAATFLIELAMESEQQGELAQASDYYRQLAQKFPSSQLGKKAAGALRRLNLEGKPLEFRLPLRSGGQITSADTRGKVTLLTFWNVECKPCQQNLPVLKDLYQKHGDKLEIIAVNVDEGPNGIAQYVEDNGVKFPIAFEPGGFNGPAATDFGVVNLPTMILADQQGRVVSVNPDIRDVQNKVPQLVK
ncbi:redoxin domain-containing protein [Alienimonas californiensis]|uniref:Thiol-disulfide oxidoreductase ResA n=1 Tax=Alienimonas californiensis TaxID=2527989 RepID=A0A517P8A7_9PLAN|nr:redoxin domain-containing protein [Alienimonas californiensis]QDT15607.1 Thiol-disulfide oxidoreductase ResA [Alienimonas californiensis]